jgi:dolichol-phosphate mannosyltransferase
MITIVVPIYNERENIEPLIKEIFEIAEAVPISEVIYVDDASTDGSWDELNKLRMQYPPLRIIRHQKNSGQSSALWTGVKAAGNDFIATLDGDGQNPPADIRLLWEG